MEEEEEGGGMERRSGLPLKDDVMFSARAILSSMLMNWPLSVTAEEEPEADAMRRGAGGLVSDGLAQLPLPWRTERPNVERSVKLICVTSSSSSSSSTASVLMTGT